MPDSKSKLRVHFYATADIAVPTLEFFFNDPRVELEKVITAPAKPQGRGQEVKDPDTAAFAKQHKIPLLQTPNINLEDEYISQYSGENGPDLFIVFAFGQFLKSNLLQIPKLGPFNIHASLLPKWRGAAPIQWSLLNGDTETGITIQRMVKKMDAGDIALQRKLAIFPNETSESLFEKMKRLSPDVMDEFLEKILHQKLSFTPQNENDATFAPTLNKEMAYVDFTKLTRQVIKNRLKAFYPWPGNFCFLNNKRLKIFEVENSPENQLKPGHVTTHMGELVVGCLDGALRLTKIQLEGKKITTDGDLLNGIKDKKIVINEDNS